MAVYTEVSAEQVQALLTELGQGRLLSWTGVADGLENSTYFLTCEGAAPGANQGSGKRDWVLSILELASPGRSNSQSRLSGICIVRGCRCRGYWSIQAVAGLFTNLPVSPPC